MIDLIDKRTGDAFCENEQEVMKKAFIPLLKLVNNFQGIQGRSDAGNPDMTVEIIDCHMTLNPMAPYLDFGGVRRTNADYAEAEINWFMSRNRCIKGWPMIEDNTIWSRIATDKGMVNSNYGWCAFSPENGNGKRSQYDFAIEQLLKHPDGRQALIYYGRPQIQWEWNDGKHAKYDMICNILTQLLIRQNRLYYIQTIRSNDAIFGFINNFIWHCYMYQKREYYHLRPEQYREVMQAVQFAHRRQCAHILRYRLL